MKNWNPHNLKDQDGNSPPYIDNFTNWQISFWQRMLANQIEKESKFSILIQGPLNNRSVSTIPRYLEYGKVIVSCWESDDLSLIKDHRDKVKLIVNKFKDLPTYKESPGSHTPWIFQNYTTLKGLEQCETFNCIKVRSDESFPDLDAFTQRIMINKDMKNLDPNFLNENKITTSNIYFRKDAEKKFHPSDHIIGGKTSRLLEVFKKSVELCTIDSRSNLVMFPEQLICKAIIESSRIKPGSREHEIMDPRSSKQLMKRHFSIVRIKYLKERVWTSSYRKYNKLFNEEFGWCNDIEKI
jgi:hypothetical protein